jgi:hypothetical protein
VVIKVYDRLQKIDSGREVRTEIALDAKWLSSGAGAKLNDNEQVQVVRVYTASFVETHRPHITHAKNLLRIVTSSCVIDRY